MKYSLLATLLFVSSTCFANNDIAINNQARADQFLAPHPVGSCYGGGVVFYVNHSPNPPKGQQGLIAALNDAPNSFELMWDSSGRTGVVGTSSKYFTGQNNTANILNTVNDIPSTGDKTWPAAKSASEYSTSETCPTCSPWYLPSQNELATLYFQSSNFDGFWTNPKCSGKTPSPQLYWSSTQYDYNVAWYVDFDTGRTLYYPTLGSFLGVRAVRAF